MASSRWMVRLHLLLCLVHHLPAVYGTDLYACSGETVTLPCDGPADRERNEVEVSWMFGSVTICSFKNGISICGHRDFVNRAQLGYIQENNFSLIIDDVKVQDRGGYKCLINGAVMQRNRLFVDGGRKRRAAETPPEGPVCKPYKEASDENPPGAPSRGQLRVEPSVFAGIVTVTVLLL